MSGYLQYCTVLYSCHPLSLMGHNNIYLFLPTRQQIVNKITNKIPPRVLSPFRGGGI